ncbi:hypothetical protein SDC9_119841 [bioreactor metagenome]|uniref:Uncharacterized protein n=1 Tax=bioreactor metagenome TaxID=1076179 RepID=A0A645C5L9_9ZZZZ
MVRRGAVNDVRAEPVRGGCVFEGAVRQYFHCAVLCRGPRNGEFHSGGGDEIFQRIDCYPRIFGGDGFRAVGLGRGRVAGCGTFRFERLGASVEGEAGVFIGLYLLVDREVV